MQRCPSGTRLLILDLDGTLIDSAPGIVRTFNATLLDIGVAPAPALDVAALIGLPLEDMYRRLLPAHLLSHIPDRVAAYRRRYAVQELPSMRAFAGVDDTLRRWRQQGGVSTVATSKRAAVAMRAIEVAGLASLIGMIVGDDQVTRKKPHPEMVLRILSAYHCAPEQALLVGDTTHDLR
ncbi:MAG TPA: HAD family hydrolase, partial [Chloroflexota bacterium]|nr:HAD family hydrolase [Chloroflexota bacterium]